MNAVFEAIVNAVARRDYSSSGSKIRLHMFADRLEIFSPGGLPNSLSLDEIGSRQFARNELICTCLARFLLPSEFATPSRMRIIDRRGEGIPVIISNTEKLSGMVPRYRLLDDSELMLTIPSAPIDDREQLHGLVKGGTTPHIGDTKSGNVPINAGASGDVPINVPINSKVLKVIEQKPGINREKLAEELQVDVKTIGRAIAVLAGQVEHRGSKKTGGYYLVGRE